MKFSRIKVIIIFIIFLFTSVYAAQAQDVKASVLDIKYYSKSQCNTNNTSILVRVRYKVQPNEIKSLYITHQYANGTQSTHKIEKIDRQGSIVYDFCIKTDKPESIVTTFKTEDGKISNSVRFIIDTSKNKIISGTPPQIFQI